MATTCKLIAKTTLGSSASSVSFDSVPGTYTDLVVLFSARSSNSGAFIDGAFPRFNNDTTAGNYSARRLFGTGGAAFSDTNGNVALIPTAQNTASTFGNAAIYIPNYAGSTNKSYSVDSAQETNASTAYVCASAGLWSNTSAITRVDIYATSGNNFVTNSSFYLYGITKA